MKRAPVAMSVVLVAVFLMSGCVVSYSDGDSDEPGISMSVSRQNQNGVQKVSATLTAVSGPVDDWGDLDVDGCTAPSEGVIEVPYEFSNCSWNIKVRYAPTGEVLYST